MSPFRDKQSPLRRSEGAFVFRLSSGFVFARRRYLDRLRADKTTAGFAMEAVRFQGSTTLLLRVLVADDRDPGRLRYPALRTEF